MKKVIYGFIAGGILGVAAGFTLGIFYFPFLFPPPPAMEEVADAENKRVVATGQFIHANPSDPVHYGKGEVTVYEDLVHLGMDFEVGPGPAFHVYLVSEEVVTPDTIVDQTMYVDLGRLKAFEGSQNYPIPAGTKLSDYPHVVVWCEKFGVLISPAKLTFQGS